MPCMFFCCDRVFHGHGSDSCVHGNALYLGLPTPTYYSTVPVHSEPESFQRSFDTEPIVYGALACVLPCKVGVPMPTSSHGPVAPVCAKSRKTVATCTIRSDIASIIHAAAHPCAACMVWTALRHAMNHVGSLGYANASSGRMPVVQQTCANVGQSCSKWARVTVVVGSHHGQGVAG